MLDYIVPGNDDAIRSIQLVTARLADAIVEVRGGAAEESAPTEAGEGGDTRETLPTPVSSPERTIAMAAKRGPRTRTRRILTGSIWRKRKLKSLADGTPQT